MNRFFPIWLHVIVASSAAGLAAGLHHVQPVDIVMAYTATGLAVGLGVTAFVRFMFMALGD